MPLTPKQKAEMLRLDQAKGGLAKFLKPSKIKHRVYHGTMSSDINQFRTPAFFANKQAANQFADPEYLYGSSKLEPHEHPNVMPVHLRLKNPKIYTTDDEYENHVMGLTSVPQHLVKQGHDGIIYAPNGDITHPDAYYVAFHPHQIKSAIGNRGTYDPNNPDITKAAGGNVSTPSQDVMRLAINQSNQKANGGSVPANKRMIEDVYNKYPIHPFNANQRAMVEGEGEDQTLGTFELKPSLSARNAVEVDWLSAYPHRQGVGSRTLKKLQEHAAEHGVALTLFPWEHGGVSQSKLIKFYKKHGFVPTVKGGKHMIWSPQVPDQKAYGGSIRFKHNDSAKEVSPQAFLHAVKPLDMDKDDKQTIAKFKAKMKDGKKINPLEISKTGYPDGRHRATAAIELGAKKVPVIDKSHKLAHGGKVTHAHHLDIEERPL